MMISVWTVGFWLTSVLSIVWSASVSFEQSSRTEPTKSDYEHVTFWEISGYDYNPAERFSAEPRKVAKSVPDRIRTLSGRKVRLVGTMLPLEIAEGGGVRTFILSTNADSCGFGMPLRINEWAFVTMRPGQTTKPADTDVLVKGTFEVREVVTDGRVVGLYHLLADEVQR